MLLKVLPHSHIYFRNIYLLILEILGDHFWLQQGRNVSLNTSSLQQMLYE